MRGRFAKEFHVSPFMGMDHTYAWRMTEPGEQLIVHIESERDGAVAFDATLVARAPAVSTPALLARHPPLHAARSSARIYANGLASGSRARRYFPNPSGAPLAGPGAGASGRAARARAAEDARHAPARCARRAVRGAACRGDDDAIARRPTSVKRRARRLRG